jgi:hypothetical protein
MGWQGTDPIRWAAKTKDASRAAINIFAFEVFRRVVERTPVDTGAARQNWLVTTNNETNDYDLSKAKGGRAMSDGKKTIDNAKGDDTIFIQNSVPYIRMLEYGGYGVAKGQGKSLIGKKRPTKEGLPQGDSPSVERQKREKQPSKITADGFSLQAPHGMVGVTLAKADALWERAVQAATLLRAEQQAKYEKLFGG